MEYGKLGNTDIKVSKLCVGWGVSQSLCKPSNWCKI